MRSVVRGVALLATQVAILPSCVTTQLETVGPWRVRHAAIHKVAVAPFANLTSSGEASRVVTDALQTELLARGAVDLVDATRAVSPAYEGRIERSRALQIGQQLGVDAVLYGTVLESEYFTGAPQKAGEVPTLSVHARLVSSSTGEVLWAAGILASRLQLFAYDSIPIEELALNVSRDLIDDLMPHLQGGGGVAGAGAPAEVGDEVAPAEVDFVQPEATPAEEAAPTEVEPVGEGGPATPAVGPQGDAADPGAGVAGEAGPEAGAGMDAAAAESSVGETAGGETTEGAETESATAGDAKAPGAGEEGATEEGATGSEEGEEANEAASEQGGEAEEERPAEGDASVTRPGQPDAPP